MKQGAGTFADLFDLTPYQLMRALGAKPRKPGTALARLKTMIGDHDVD